MKNVAKLSLVACMCVASSFADNIEDVFKNAKYSGEIKTEFSRSNFLGRDKYDNIGVLGGNLSGETGSFYGIKIGATFQASHVLFDDDNDGDEVNSNDVFAGDLDASGASLSQIYLSYTFSKTELKAGRQYIYTPLVSSAIDGKSSESVIKDSFEAYLLSTQDIPNTTIALGYVNKYQGKTDGDENIGDFNKYEDGAYTVFAKNTSVKNLTLQAQYLHVDGLHDRGDKDAIYFQADYTLSGHNFSFQYLASKDKARETNQEGQLFGLRATGGLGFGKLGYLAAFNASTKDGDTFLGAGSGTTDTPFTAMPVNGGGVPARSNANTIVGGVIVPLYGVVLIPYGGKSFSSKHPLGDVTALGAMAMYSVGKNLSFKLNYEYVKTEHVFDENTQVMRLYASYRF